MQDAVKIKTERLELIAATAETAQAEIDDRPRFFHMLDARPTPNWPPPLNDEASMAWMADYLREHAAAVGWAMWYFTLPAQIAGEPRTLIGNGGFKGSPAPTGQVEIGYSLLEEYQRFGYATEAAKGLIAWAFAHEEVTSVAAETLPELAASIHVLEKCGFRLVGAGSEPGVIRYELVRGAVRRRTKDTVTRRRER